MGPADTSGAPGNASTSNPGRNPDDERAVSASGGSERLDGSGGFGGLSGLAGLLGRRFAWMLGAQWGSGLITAAFMIPLARSGPELFGLITLGLTVGSLAALVVDAGFRDHLVTLFTERHTPPRLVLGRALFFQTLLLAAALAGVLGLCLLLDYGPEKSLVVMVIAAGMGTAAAGQSGFVLCRALGRQDTETRITLVAAAASAVFGLLCLALGAPPAVIAFFKPVEGLVVCLLVCRVLRPRSGDPLAGAGTWFRRGSRAPAFACIALCAYLYNRLNIYMLDRLEGSGPVGLYAAPWEIVDGLCIVVSGALIAKVLYPCLAGQWEGNRELFSRVAGAGACGLLLAGLSLGYALFVEGDRLLTLIYGADYAPAAPLLRALLPCIAAAFLHNLAAYLLLGMRRVKTVLGIYAAGLAMNVALCLALIPAHGALGAAWAVSGTKIGMACCGLAALAPHVPRLRFFPLAGVCLAAAAAFGLHALLRPAAPREAAEAAGLLPLLVPLGVWLSRSARREGGEHAG